MKRVLVLEDSPDRIRWFREAFDEWVIDVTAATDVAIQWLRVRKYDMIFLDHDLDDEHYQAMLQGSIDGLRGCGQDVANFLAQNPLCQEPCTIIVHSLNQPGSKRMHETLVEAGRTCLKLPFYKLMDTKIG